MQYAIAACLGSTLLYAVAQPASAVGDAQTQHQPAVVYRGKPLSFYLIETKTPALRPGAIRAIGAAGRDAMPLLPEVAAALQDPEVEVRIAAAWAISQISPPHDSAAVQALARALSDPNAQVRSEAAVALRQIGPGAAEAVPELIAALNDPADFVRAPAADALGNIGPAAKAAVKDLTARLEVKDEQVFVLRSVATALGNIGPDARAALPALRNALKMVRVVYAAQEAILKILGEPVPTYIRKGM